MVKAGYRGMEKRKHPRTTYPTGLGPMFQTNGQAFKVKDISKGGLKFCHQEKVKIQGWVKGTMDLSDGNAIELEGIVVRAADKEMGLWFIGELEDHVYNQIADQSNNGNEYPP
jgi:hypothetical protein